MKIHALPKRRNMTGVTLVEMMVAIAIGLVLTAVMLVIYTNSRSATRRVDQLSAVQQSVRTAFEYMAFDSRMVGHLGCFTGSDLSLLGVPTPTTLANNFRVGIEGYEFTGTAPNDTYTLTSLPTDLTTDTSWATGIGTTTAQIPLSTIAGGGTNGLTPGSDVLVVRSTAVGRPVRITATVSGGATTAVSVDTASTGSCPDGTANLGGFCAGSLGVIASCTAAQSFQVTSLTASAINLASPITGSNIYTANATEVFPMQTVVYYVKRSSSNTTTSLYRRVFDGAQEQDQELIEGVESLQVRYGVDTDTDVDGIINGDYRTANNVSDWSRVIAIRISLLMRAPTASEADIITDTTKTANGVTFTLPTTGPKFDRRVFTTTVALRNRIAYARP